MAVCLTFSFSLFFSFSPFFLYFIFNRFLFAKFLFSWFLNGLNGYKAKVASNYNFFSFYIGFFKLIPSLNFGYLTF